MRGGASSPVSYSVKILGGGAIVLLLLLLVGYLLPGTWEADASKVVSASAEAVMPYLDSPEGWREWTPWPENGVERTGPDHGEGATLSWDDPDLGVGSFTLGATSPDSVAYSVDVQEGAMRTDGVITLTPVDGGVRVDWREHGDFGWNPLMGYWALFMHRAQSQELSKGLDRLDAVARAGSEPGTETAVPSAGSEPNP
jgi:hypothetical protein